VYPACPRDPGRRIYHGLPRPCAPTMHPNGAATVRGACGDRAEGVRRPRGRGGRDSTVMCSIGVGMVAASRSYE
jgi:hypothetical protein